MEEFEDEFPIPKRLLERMSMLLGTDGFKQTAPGMFVKDMGAEWKAWIAISGESYSLDPRIGVYNEELVNIGARARAMVGYPSTQPPETGPPLIMKDLEQLIGEDADCQKHLTWHMDLEEHIAAGRNYMPELKTEVADDLVYCLRKKAFPFFVAHTTFQSIVDAISTRECWPSPACIHYFPLILIKLGLGKDIPRFVKERAAEMKNENVADLYERYVDALLKLVPAWES
ncbi:MAG TPA: hypothetical protein VMF67_01395 [Rhizomicrobium sp.]|nr:hypothetical protein [Rhizomicrobium sp.]